MGAVISRRRAAGSGTILTGPADSRLRRASSAIGPPTPGLAPLARSSLEAAAL